MRQLWLFFIHFFPFSFFILLSDYLSLLIMLAFHCFLSYVLLETYFYLRSFLKLIFCWVLHIVYCQFPDIRLLILAAAIVSVCFLCVCSVPHDILLGRWRLALDLFGRVFVDDVGLEPGEWSDTYSLPSKVLVFFFVDIVADPEWFVGSRTLLFVSLIADPDRIGIRRGCKGRPRYPF